LTALLEQADLQVEYAALVDSSDLRPLTGEVASGQACVLLAARVGTTRLIDNLVLGVDEPPAWIEQAS
jgi:pantothenate synthetase